MAREEPKGGCFTEAEIIRSNRASLAAEIKAGKLIIRAPSRASDEDIQAFLLKHRAWIQKNLEKSKALVEAASAVPKLTAEEFHRLVTKALEVIPARVRYYAPQVGVQYGRITIRNQRSKWGSCSAIGNLNFNCLLMLAPPEVLDAIVVHELCHLKELNHSQRFYAEVLRIFPEYHKWNQWLKENGTVLMSRMPE